MEENMFKCPNDLRVSIKKDNGEMVLDESCCTSLSIIVKNSGEMATSFLGAHSPELVKILEKTLKKYFKTLKKTLKEEYKKPSPDEIKVIKGDSEENSKEIEKALSKEVDVDIKYEFDSLKDIEKAIKEGKGEVPSSSGKTAKANKKNTKASKPSASSKNKGKTDKTPDKANK